MQGWGTAATILHTANDSLCQRAFLIVRTRVFRVFIALVFSCLRSCFSPEENNPRASGSDSYDSRVRFFFPSLSFLSAAQPGFFCVFLFVCFFIFPARVLCQRPRCFPLLTQLSLALFKSVFFVQSSMQRRKKKKCALSHPIPRNSHSGFCYKMVIYSTEIISRGLGFSQSVCIR